MKDNKKCAIVFKENNEKAAVGVFAGNAYSLVVQQGILKNFIKDNKDGGKPSPLLPALEEAQTKGKKDTFLKLVASYELAALERYVKVLGS